MSRPRYKAPSGQEVIDRHFVLKYQNGKSVINSSGEALIGAVLDNDSITKRKFGKLTYGINLGIGIQQLLHPEIGAAVEHTGKFWANPYNRVVVSADPIMAVMFAEDPYAAGEHVRRLHEGIYGTDHKGRHFNALSKDAFYWAHDTFQQGNEILAEHYSPEPFTDEDRQEIQWESNTWYSYYGMPMDMVPADYPAKLEYRQYMLDNVLESNPSADRAISMAIDRNPPRPEFVPKRVWGLAKAALTPVTEMISLVTIGELPVDIREKFGIPFSEDEQKHLEDIRNVARTFLHPLPDPVIYYPKAYEDQLRERGGRHKSFRDRLIHRGNVAVTNTVTKGLEVAQSVQSRIAA